MCFPRLFAPIDPQQQFEGLAALERYLLNVLVSTSGPGLGQGQAQMAQHDAKKWEEEDVNIEILCCDTCVSHLVCAHLLGTESRSTRCAPAGAKSIILRESVQVVFIERKSENSTVQLLTIMMTRKK